MYAAYCVRRWPRNRVLRTVYSAINNIDFSSRSGGTEGRPVEAYIESNMGDISASTVSASPLMLRRGCACGTRDSGDMRHSIEDWWVWAPRMTAFDHTLDRSATAPLHGR